MEPDTRGRILEASLKLFSEQGYASVTTRSIALEAKVNEVTIFRIFGQKKNLYREVFHTYSIQPSAELLLKDIEYDPESDLVRFGNVFTDLIISNSKIVTMSFNSINKEIQDIAENLKQQSVNFKEYLKPYFREMKERDLLIGDPEDLASAFTDILFGCALKRLKDKNTGGLRGQISLITKIFARGIRKDH